MSLAWFRFYEELNELLPTGKRKIRFPYSFKGDPSVKDAIEAQGVPHTEVDMILANDLSVDFSYRLQDGDRVSVFPLFESFDITTVTRLRNRPLRNPRFILDVHLGKLARYMRLCGLDTYYMKDYDDREIIDIAVAEKRIILTRDIGLLKNRRVTHGYFIRSQHAGNQLKEVLRRFHLKRMIKISSRCTMCNGILTEVPKRDIEDLLPPGTRKYFNDFMICPQCNKIYWEGSHIDRIKRYIEDIADDI